MDILKELSISDKEKQKSKEEIISGSEPNLNFYVMVVLSAIIATFGLLSNNVAVIIGAMLVAPLMLPIISIAMAMIFVDVKLLHKSLSAELKGVVLAIVISVFMTLLLPVSDISNEILIRTRPTIVDLLLAFASGAAAAYAIMKRMNATLPGVAIAVSILPPLCVSGIGLALKRFDIFTGGFLLFLANVIAINIATFVVFWIFKFYPKGIQDKDKKSLVKRNIVISIVLLLIIAIPLGFIMYETIIKDTTRKLIENTLKEQISVSKVSELVSFNYEIIEGKYFISATIRSSEDFDNKMATGIKNALAKKLNMPVELEINIILMKNVVSS